MINGVLLRDSIVSGANNITNKKSIVDELNVFPVPDGDTGTNMSMTINSAMPELLAMPANCTVDQVASVTSSAMLRGARGNSGVILSLIFRGFARALQGKTEASSHDISESLTKGVEAAYKAVMKPTEGTMLTVARVSAEKVKEVYKTMDPVALWAYIVEVANETLLITPDLLPILKKAGVVDSGGQGLCYIFEGMLSVLRDGSMVDLASGAVSMASSGKGVFTEDIDPNLTNAYCTEFLVIKNSSANDIKLRAYLESIGDSVVVVDDDELIKCHVHTEQPGKALGEAVRHGYLSKIKIENMLEQYEARQAEGRAAQQEQPAAAPAESAAPEEDHFEYVPRNPDIAYGFVTVSSGAGLKNVFQDLGVDRIVNGGQTMNPSTDDILAAIHSVAARNIVVLANNKNIIMSAEQACKLADRKAVVLPTRNIPQGIAAMLVFDPDDTLENNLIAMNEAAGNVTSGQVTTAVRDSEIDGYHIKEGEYLAMINGKISSSEKDSRRAIVKLARKTVRKGVSSFVTLIYGSDISEEEAEAATAEIRKVLPGEVELTVINGGQPVYCYYLSVE